MNGAATRRGSTPRHWPPVPVLTQVIVLGLVCIAKLQDHPATYPGLLGVRIGTLETDNEASELGE
jgi:hypothetical protein